jgi:hypothetical protein
MIDLHDANDQERIDEDENEFDSAIETAHAYRVLDEAIQLADTAILTKNGTIV